MRYSPRTEFPAKRYERLRKCENALAHRIAVGTGRQEVERAAERVKQAQMLVLKGLRHFFTKSGTAAGEKIHERQLKKIQDETVVWETRSIEEIIEMYRGFRIRQRNLD